MANQPSRQPCRICGAINRRNQWGTYKGLRVSLCPTHSELLIEIRDKDRKVDKATRARVFQRAGNKCTHCGTTQRLTLDHIKPVALGGNGHESNLQVLCHSCNSKKGIH